MCVGMLHIIFPMQPSLAVPLGRMGHLGGEALVCPPTPQAPMLSPIKA
jgi:hypothetical protein